MGRVLNGKTTLRTLLNTVKALRRVLKGVGGIASRDLWDAVEDPGPPVPGHSAAGIPTTVWARESHHHSFSEVLLPHGSGVPGLCGFPEDSLGILYTGGGPEWGSRRTTLIPGFIFSDCAEPLLGGLSHTTVATPVLLKLLQ